jgi:flagellar hook-length control protein FliK
LSSFTTGMADRLLTLATPGTHEARLKLHPESLGALDVEITVEDGQAQVWFGTSSAQARDAIENSLPRLKELFAEQGITLTRTQVEHGGADARHQQANRQRQFGDEVPVTRPIRTPVPTSLVAPGLAGPSATRLLDVLA